MVGIRIPPAPRSKPRRLNLDARAYAMVLGSAVGRLFVEECYPRLHSEIDNRRGDERDARTEQPRAEGFMARAEKIARFLDINATNLEIKSRKVLSNGSFYIRGNFLRCNIWVSYNTLAFVFCQ